MSYRIRFSKPSVSAAERALAAQCLESGDTAGGGEFSKRCQELIERRFGAKSALLTTSCTSALEMAALLCEVGTDDEVILPSYTFVSTANAFLLRGARLKFVDIRSDTLNMDERLLAAAITPRTKIIVPVHYAGVGCEMETILSLARACGAHVVEDAAQAVNAAYNDAFLGTLGTFGTYSFHATKNLGCGEGGALLVNDPKFVERAEIIREKGTNRSRFFRGQVDKYTWVDVGSSYVLSDLLAAVLLAQLQRADEITAERGRSYARYHDGLEPLAARGLLTLPMIPPQCRSNFHIYHVLTESLAIRTALIEHLKAAGILAVFHYVPLHTSPMGKTLGYESGMLPVTESVSDRLLRLPLYSDLTTDDVDDVIDAIFAFFRVRRTNARRDTIP